MGHYDEMYEADAEKASRERQKRWKEFNDKVDKLRECAPAELPARFLDALEDMRNWLRVRL